MKNHFQAKFDESSTDKAKIGTSGWKWDSEVIRPTRLTWSKEEDCGHDEGAHYGNHEKCDANTPPVALQRARNHQLLQIFHIRVVIDG